MGDKVVKETIKHMEAFDLYYSLGGSRSCAKVAEQLSISKTSIEKWGRSFNWVERAKMRDIGNSKKLESKTNQTLMNTKAAHRKTVKDNILMTKALMSTMVDPVTKQLKKNIEAKSIADYDKLSATLDRLIKLDLTLMGERAELDGIDEIRVTIVNKKTVEEVSDGE